MTHKKEAKKVNCREQYMFDALKVLPQLLLHSLLSLLGRAPLSLFLGQLLFALLLHLLDVCKLLACLRAKQNTK